MTLRTNLAFSLHELLLILALISISAFIALPVVASFKQKSQHEMLRNELHSALYNARTQAILYRRSVELCAIDDNKTCAHKWQNGWKSHFLDTPQLPIDIHQRQQASPLYWTGFSKTIRFHANGTSPTSNGRFFQCSNGLVTWQLIINRQGRVRVGTATENHSQAHRCPN